MRFLLKLHEPDRHLLSWVVFLLSTLFSVPLMAEMPPPPTVGAAAVVQEQITEWLDYTGRLTAVDTVELRPRISGQLKQVHVQEGALVEVGDLLFEIDDRPFLAVLNQAKAQKAQASTQLQQAQREAKRGADLRKRNVISQEDFEARTAAEATAQAQLASADAALESAELNVEFTRVIAPIAGRISLAEVTEGNWVQAGQTRLTRLVATDRLYVTFQVDERTFLERAAFWVLAKTEIKIGLMNDTGYSQRATLSFIDNQVDPLTGTIQLRATLHNPSDQMRPGLFSRVSIAGKGPYEAILINERAIATDQGSRYVLVIDESNLAQYRPIELGPKIGELRVVRSGLAPGEVIVVKGLMKANPGAPVVPNSVSMRTLQPLDTSKDLAASQPARD